MNRQLARSEIRNCAALWRALTFWTSSIHSSVGHPIENKRLGNSSNEAVFGHTLAVLEVRFESGLGDIRKGPKMRCLKILTLLGISLVAVPYAHAQNGPGNGAPGYSDPRYAGPGYVDPYYIGAPPVCPYGYYEYYPYACAPYGYYGPAWFSGGIFIGAGPWYGRSYYGGRGFYGRPGGGFAGRGRGFAAPGRGFVAPRGSVNGGAVGRGQVGGGFRSFQGGGSARSGNSFQGGGSFHGGGGSRGSGGSRGGGGSRGSGGSHGGRGR